MRTSRISKHRSTRGPRMKRRKLLERGAVLFGLLLAGVGSLPAAGAGAAPPNFAPDSIIGWIAVPGGFKAPPSGPGPIRNDPAHPVFVNLQPNYPPSGRIVGPQPTFAVADVSNPILQPWAREELKRRNDRILAGGTGFGRQASCWPVGTPGFLLHGVQPVYFIQTVKEIVMVWQEDYQTRRIFMNVPHSDKLHVIERFRILDGGKTLEVNVHVEDPGAFTTPWNAIQRYTHAEFGPMIEVSCAEGMMNDYFHLDQEPIPQ